MSVSMTELSRRYQAALEFRRIVRERVWDNPGESTMRESVEADIAANEEFEALLRAWVDTRARPCGRGGRRYRALRFLRAITNRH